MSKRFSYIVCLILLCNILLQAKQVELCENCPISSVKEALDIIQDCDTIMVKSGVYTMDQTTIDKAVHIIGVNYPVFVSKSGEEILTVNAHHVHIKGIRFKGVTTSYLKEHAAIRIAEKKHFLIEDNIIDSCFFGIYLQRAKSGTIRHNIINGNATTEAESGNGIHAWYSKDIHIHNNEVYGHRDGIYFEFVDDSHIEYNLSEGNKRYGLHFMFSNHDDYLYNTFKNNGVGVAVMFSRFIKMHHNTFSYNWGAASYGLLLKEIFDAEINSNLFEQNTMGIFVEGSNRLQYENNRFIRNGWAINFSGGCEDNEIHYNDFVNNSLDLVINSGLNDNSIHHNYWSNYSGYDLDKDEIGDVPYYPVKLFYYIIDRTPEAIVLMRSLFVDIINFAEKVSPIFTPKDVFDPHPLMTPHHD